MASVATAGPRTNPPLPSIALAGSARGTRILARVLVRSVHARCFVRTGALVLQHVALPSCQLLPHLSHRTCYFVHDMSCTARSQHTGQES